MEINKMVKLKNGKYKLYFDDNNELITYDDIILNYNLLFKKNIDDDLYLKIIEENIYYELLNKAIKFISKRLRSEKEISNYLLKYTLDDILINNIICYLKDKGFIDDCRFCKSYINDKLNLSNSGIFKIKKELLNLGVDENIIDNEIKLIDLKVDKNKLRRIIEKKINCNHKYSESFLKHKILNDLVNMGYDKDDVVEILDSYTFDDNEIYNKEYLKIYNKLKNKYQGSELDFQVNRRMMAKGFKKNRI